jgi:hypothetical protein
MFLLDRLKRHGTIDEIQSDGLSAAIEAVRQFDQRTFRVKGRGIRASHVVYEEVSRFLDEEFPGYYTYTTKVQIYEDRHDVRHARIEIKGWSGLSQRMNRYNPFDMTVTIRTEPPTSKE